MTLLNNSWKVLIGALGLAETRIWSCKTTTVRLNGLLVTLMVSSSEKPENEMMAEDREKPSLSVDEREKTKKIKKRTTM